MNLNLLALQFAPLVIYLLVDLFKGFRAGIYAAMATSLLGVVIDVRMTGEWDKMLLGEAFLVIVLGWVSLRMNNERYFKFQPSVVAGLFTLIFAYFQIFDKPLLISFIPHMEKLFQASQSTSGAGQALENPMLASLHDPQMMAKLGKLSFACIWLFLVHGLIMAYAALRLSTRAWVAWRLAIYPGLFAMVVVFQMLTQ